MPRDNFRRERERRIVSAVQFNNVLTRVLSQDRYIVYGNNGSKQIEEMHCSVDKKAFQCNNCKKSIISTAEQRINRMKISCMNCGETYKLNPEYATKDGETIQYENLESENSTDNQVTL